VEEADHVGDSFISGWGKELLVQKIGGRRRKSKEKKKFAKNIFMSEREGEGLVDLQQASSGGLQILLSVDRQRKDVAPCAVVGKREGV